MTFYYNKNCSESSLNFLPPSVALNKPSSVGGGLGLNNGSRDGEVASFGGLPLKRSPPVTFPEYLSKLKRGFKSKSLLLAVVGTGYP